MNRALAVLIVLVIAPPCATPAAAQPVKRVEYYHLDVLGSVRAVTDQQGHEIARHDYLPFMEEWPQATFKGTPLFTGKQRDAESALDYFGARHYAARAGRFTTVDPALDMESALEDPQRWNRYSYAVNRPARFADPDGASPVLINLINQSINLVRSVASSPAAQRVQQVMVNQGARAWVALTRLFNTPGGREALQTVAEFVTGMESPASPTISDAATAIGAGHALVKHADDFTSVGAKTAGQAATFIQGVILAAKESDKKVLSNGRYAFFDNNTGFVVIIDPKHADKGTAFIPKQGRSYFDKTLK